MEEKLLRQNILKRIRGNSPKIRSLQASIEKAAKTESSVVLLGEAGTGKESSARLIHEFSSRSQGPFVVVTTAAIPEELESIEFFGEEKMFARQVGSLELAQKGTLFIDEVATLSLGIQAKLVQAIERKEIWPAGSIIPIPIDIRLMGASQKNLEEELDKGKLRADFYYLLKSHILEIPPLRERANDILLLSNLFLREICKENKLALVGLSNEAKEKLLNYHYPGNIRELRSMLEAAVLLSDSQEIDSELIQLRHPKPKESWLEEGLTLKQYTRKIIDYYLEKYDNNVLLVAKKLAIGKSTIYRILQEKN